MTRETEDIEIYQNIQRHKPEDKHYRHEDKKETWSGTLGEGLSRNYGQNRTLQLISTQTRGPRVLEGGAWNHIS